MESCKGDKSCKCGFVCREFFPLILVDFLEDSFVVILMDFPIQIATIRLGLSIIYFKGS